MAQEPIRGRRDRAAEALERFREKLAGVEEDGWFFAVIAQQVADRRKELSLSQAELAELVATTQSAIARLESGGRPPRIDTLLRIAAALDCELLVELRPRTKPRTKTKKRGGR
jgi:DNA-binding XRE family transcriptional regulator